MITPGTPLLIETDLIARDFSQPIQGSNAKTEEILFYDVLKDCNKIAGEGNINEFMPYTILSLTNKIFYFVLFVINFSNVQNHGGDSANGVTYRSKVVDTVNAFSVMVTGLALMGLVGLSAKNTFGFKRVVKKKEIPLEMKHEIFSINRTRGLRIVHTGLAAGINIVNGVFQLMQEGVFSTEQRLEDQGKQFAKDTAIPALAFILSKNALDFLSNAASLAICQANILALKSINDSQDIQGCSDLKDRIIVCLTEKRKNLLFSTISSGLVSTGMTVLLIGVTGRVPVSLAVSIFLGTATLGQGIPLGRSFLSKCCSGKKLAPEAQSLLVKDSDSLVRKIYENAKNNGVATRLIGSLRSGICCRHPKTSEELENGLKNVSKILF